MCFFPDCSSSIIQFIAIKSSDEEMKKRHDEKEKRVKAGKRENNIDSICIIQRTKVGHYFFHVKWAVLRIGASEWDLLSLKHHTNRFYSNQVEKKMLWSHRFVVYEIVRWIHVKIITRSAFSMDYVGLFHTHAHTCAESMNSVSSRKLDSIREYCTFYTIMGMKLLSIRASFAINVNNIDFPY